METPNVWQNFRRHMLGQYAIRGEVPIHLL